MIEILSGVLKLILVMTGLALVMATPVMLITLLMMPLNLLYVKVMGRTIKKVIKE